MATVTEIEGVATNARSNRAASHIEGMFRVRNIDGRGRSVPGTCSAVEVRTYTTSGQPLGWQVVYYTTGNSPRGGRDDAEQLVGLLNNAWRQYRDEGRPNGQPPDA